MPNCTHTIQSFRHHGVHDRVHGRHDHVHVQNHHVLIEKYKFHESAISDRVDKSKDLTYYRPVRIQPFATRFIHPLALLIHPMHSSLHPSFWVDVGRCLTYYIECRNSKRRIHELHIHMVDMIRQVRRHDAICLATWFLCITWLLLIPPPSNVVLYLQ